MMTNYGEEQPKELEALESIHPDSFTVLSENSPSFTITVISEAGENDETVQTTLKFTYGQKYPDEVPLYEILEAQCMKFMHGGRGGGPQPGLHPLQSETPWRQSDIPLTIWDRWLFSQENLGDNIISSNLKLLVLQAEENLGMVMIFTLVTAVQEKLNETFLEDAGNNVEVDESLSQEIDDLELEDDEDNPYYNTPDPESDLTN
ncbi:hypothetical protein QTO34_000225 [Cnephaeus nilssonii]|uniref:RWD domain-containing protein n=1 Tax=Cnephaeus nilssonii TaxID=3371016 RepID=A0AA40IBW3_CNENI|nr:hypothetical protein QTO34_000225 [Eptesicus nilssonii]